MENKRTITIKELDTVIINKIPFLATVDPLREGQFILTPLNTADKLETFAGYSVDITVFKNVGNGQ